MATPTLTEDDEKTGLNPGQQHADTQFGTHDKIPGYDRAGDGLDDIDPFSSKQASDLKAREDASTDTTTGSNAGNILNAEQNFHTSNFTGNTNTSTVKLSGKPPKGPIGWIIGIVLGGGAGFSMLTSPGLLLVHIKETMVDKFNYQLSSMDSRTNKILRLKINGVTKGVCGPVIKIGCKFSTMSDKQVAKFKAAGIEVKTDGKTIFGRNKPTGFKMIGDDSPPISAKDFDSARKTNAEFNNRVRGGFNPKDAGFNDSKWKKLAAKDGLSKNPKIDGDTDEKRAASMNESTKNGFKDDGTRVKAGDKNPATGEAFTEEEANKVNGVADDLAKQTDNIASEVILDVEKDELENIAPKVAKAGLNNLATGAKVTGAVDYACQAYRSVQTLGYAAKGVRATQLTRYALIFLSVADKIKAGVATPEEVSYLGKILTSLATDAKGGLRGDFGKGYGWNFAANGKSGKMSSFTSRFLTGGGLVGALITIPSLINKYTFGSARATCGTLANPFVGAASGIVGIILAISSGGITITAQEAAIASLGIIFSVAMVVAPILLKDILAGEVTKNLFGEDAIDAITSGAGSLMSKLANLGGNAAMKIADAISYNDLQTKTVAMYEKEEASKLSPFDPTNKYTFMGSIVSTILPNISGVSSFAGNISSLLGIVGTSVKSLVPKSSAISTEDYKASLEVCQDFDYKEMGIATDPFCNVIYGIPPQYLDRDPLEVISSLSGQIDDVTGQPLPGSDYAKFAANCIERSIPLDEASGGECTITDSNANYYLRFLDQRVNDDMDGEGAEAAASEASLPTDTNWGLSSGSFILGTYS